MQNFIRKNIKKVIETTLAATMILSISFVLSSFKANAEVPKISSPNKTVMLIPLDDRPINTDTVVKTAAASGIKLIMPPKEMIATSLQEDTSGKGSHGGNPGEVINWIIAHKDEADGFIISADQLHSGGLVESRSLYPDNTLTQAKANLNIIKELKQQYPSKPLYTFDTVMRLASTTNYESLSQAKYDAFRAFGKIDRSTESQLSTIKSNYNLASDGKTQIALPSGLTSAERLAYYNARARKLDLNYEVVKIAQSYSDYTVFGVDDSSPENTIQTNEVNWLKWHIANTIGSSKSAIVSDADGVTLNLLARMSKQLYGQPAIKYHVEYFGTDGSTVKESYHFEANLHEVLKTQVAISGGTITTTKSAADISLLVLSPDSIYRGSLVNMYNSNVTNLIPTTIIDLYGDHADDYILKNIFAGGNASRMLAYSAWNTAGNRIGIALGTGGARYNFMKYETNSTKLREASRAFVSLNIDRIIDDFEYKRIRQENIKSKITSLGGNPANMKENMTAYQIDQVDEFLITDIRSAQQYIASQFIGHRALEKVNGIRSFNWVMVDSVPTLYDEDVLLPWNRYFDLTVNTNPTSVY